ncbi:pyrroloquinoline quinone biosynthesis protein PqqB [Sulfitobacter sp. EhC04]|uniref:pyrroloquinoline quinone biosynthesis protein PqqB n=1 Tax=Sulfitobacter sp. EhC04 TaxID=1849168 RepID=UPI0007F3F451|nr:pyrroloquinoline quinone biosynthesis protein PqqB [Sulfitobacter sp. EhC04]OAN75127.1 pyrroloquinoline quinone biosynthesis protein PqqB [Sulfitobacter sp. EhC04]
MFRALILGAVAGGGLPQWNCGCENCAACRAGYIPEQTQSSIAVTANGADWAIINASPDIRQQLARTPMLHPTGVRSVPLASVLLTNGDLDHIAGLLSLREQQAFDLFATRDIHRVLENNPVFSALNPEFVTRKITHLNATFSLVSGLTCTTFAVPGKVPLFMEGAEVQTDLEGEQTVGVEITYDDARIFYIPGCAAMTDALRARLQGADIVFFDGTLWTDDEMVQAGLSRKTGKRMGHMSMSGPDGTIAAFRDIDVKEKVFVHMNNTNPALDLRSAVARDIRAAGWTIARDGMEFAL